MSSSIVPEGSLIYGIQLPIQALPGTSRQPWEEDAGVDDLIEVAKAAEAAGCSFIGVCDHVSVPRHDDAGKPMSPVWYDTVATMAYLAAHTTSVRLLSVVYIASYRHPLLSAKSFMTLDHLSGGRIVIGVGAGHTTAEFKALGVDFASRGPLLDESIDAMRAAFGSTWTKFNGKFFEYDEIGLAPRPVQEAIPIWIGGSSKPALRRVAERGDGWIPQGTPRELMRDCVDYLRAHADKVRPGEKLDLGFMPEWLYIGSPTWDLGGRSISGPPEQLAESLSAAHQFDCNVLHLHFRSRSKNELCDQLAAFGREVAPLLAQASS